ncbi:MAG: hypothetical protein KKA73_28255 [Chloroflexi bacterium]|nr:hypothetical protein [Chloroflexota bacterium]MBU1751587.1 hypothetical protein [Chloroflexota bacterium]
MSQPIDLKELERRAFLSYHQDGLLDIFVGFVIVLFGSGLGSGKPWHMVVFYPVFMLMWAGAKKAVTIPRMGYVKFGPVRVAAAQKAGVILGLALLLTVLPGSLLAFGYISLPPEWLAWLAEYFLLALGVVGAGLFGLAAFLLGIRRLYAYAVLTLTISVVGYLLMPSEPALFVMLAGGVILLVGLVLLVRFMRQYPVLAEAIVNDDEQETMNKPAQG